MTQIQAPKSNDLFVAALQTTYLLKVLKVFNPAQITKIKAFASKQIDTPVVWEDKSMGLRTAESGSSTIILDYDSDNMPPLSNKDIKLVKTKLKELGIADLTVEYLEVEIPVNFDMFDARLSRTYKLVFKNSEAPESTLIRQNIAQVNNNIYQLGSNQFRYRQLVLTFLIDSKAIGTYKKSQYSQVALIDLGEDWKHDPTVVKFGSNIIGNNNTIVAINNTLGKMCIAERFKLTNEDTWEFVGIK